MPWSRRLSVVAAVCLVILGSAVTFAWYAGVEWLIRPLPNMLPMTRNTAACFLLCGLALLFVSLQLTRWLVAASAGLAGVVGVLTLLHHFLGINTGIADLLGPRYLPTTPTGAGMALASALGFTVGAGGLVAAAWRPGQFGTIALGVCGTIVFVCGMAGLTAAGLSGGARGPALHSVLGFWTLGLGMLSLGWTSGAPTPRWLPLAVLIGILSGVLGIWQTLRADGHEAFGLVSVMLLTAGTTFGLSFAVTVYLAQRGYAQATILRRTDRELRQIIDSIPSLISLFDADGKIEYMNERIFDLTGKSKEDLLQWGSGDLVHVDDRARAIEASAAGLAAAEPYEIVYRMRRRDGKYRWFLAVHTPLRDEKGQLYRWCVSVTDIDDHKRMEEVLRESERVWRSVVNGMPGLTATLAPDGTVEAVNEKITEYTGLPLEELRNWGTNGTVHPDDMPNVAAIFGSSIAGAIPYYIEQRLRRHDGKYLWFSNRGVPALDAEGRLIRWYVLLVDIDDRKRAEDALAASERKLKLTIDTIPALAWSTTPDGKADYFSQHYLDFVGMTQEQLQGDAWAATLHPDDLANLAGAWQTIMKSGQGGEAEARIRRHDGQYRWFLQRASPLRDETGTIVRWYGVNTDIEDRKRAEASIAHEKQLLEMIAAGVPLRNVLTDLCRYVEEDAVDLLCDVHPIDWNSKTFRYGTSPSLPESYTEPIAGLPVKEELLPCAVAAFEKVQIIAEDIETDPRWQSSFVRTHVLEHGLRSVWSTPIISTGGTVLGTFCIYQRKPATPTAEHQALIDHATHIASIAIERLQTEEELRRSYERLAAAQKLSKTGNFTADVVVDNHIWSAELYRIFELDQDSTISVQHVRGVIHPEDLASFDADFQRSATDGTPFDQVFRIITKSGRLKHLHALAEVAELVDGRPVFSGAIRDVTDERLAEEALSKTRAELAHVTRVTALSTLSASIAHEVAQPLAGIVTNASTGLRMLAADPPNIEGARETARRTIRDGNRASEVVTRLRALFSSKSAVSDRVDINDAARDVIALSRGELQRKRIELAFEPAGNLPPVAGDRVQLQQVILNLLLNASDALSSVHDRPRRITVRTSLDGDGKARLTVRDTGPGIHPDASNKLFDAFFTTKASGMGIGLSVSRSIVEHHQGMIWASSNDEGPGASFSFTIPCQAAGGPDREQGQDVRRDA